MIIISKQVNIKSTLINSLTVLNSFIEIRKSEEDYEFTTSIESYEDLSKPDNDKYEFIYPKYSYSKILNKIQIKKDSLNFFLQDTKNIKIPFYEGVLVNDLIYNSD